jgi:type IV secretory pathway VirB10-like protein
VEALHIGELVGTAGATERKLAFVNTPPDRSTKSADRVSRPMSSLAVPAGNVIPTSLITAFPDRQFCFTTGVAAGDRFLD